MSAIRPEVRAAVFGGDAPWRPADLLGSAVLTGAGLAGLAAAWYGGSDQADWPDALPLASLGAVATTVAMLGLVAWLVSGFRRVHRLRREVLPALHAKVGTRGADVTSTAGSAGFVTAEGMTRFHRPGCPLVAGKPVRPLPVDESGASALVPCGVCAP
ncbi:MAG: hypothetical protein ACRD0C_06565 [Acidimicrobiia bacterium]